MPAVGRSVGFGARLGAVVGDDVTGLTGAAVGSDVVVVFEATGAMVGSKVVLADSVWTVGEEVDEDSVMVDAES